MDFGRAALACYFTFVAVFYTAKLLALRARTGESHAELGQPRTAQYVSQRLFRAFRVAIWGLCVARVAWPEIDRFLVPFEALTGSATLAVGLALLVASLSLTVYTHSYMGEAWRSGVASAGPKHLITTGPFGRIRHPLFSAIAIGQLGFFLALPSLFSLACLVIGCTVLVVQARYEEARMAAAFGRQWDEYVRAVPGLVPRLRAAAPARQRPAGFAGPVATGRSSRAPHSAQDPS